MDEEDEEPFSTASSAVVAPEPKQDVLPRRPQPGGRFPSDLEVSKARGLQVPLSPSSGSSNFEDRSVNAAAAALPGSGIGEHYESYAQENHPTHAALVNKAAEQDGINPYTSQPLSHHNSHDSSHHESRQSVPYEPRQDSYQPSQEAYQPRQESSQPRQESYSARQDRGIPDAVIVGGAGVGGAALGAAGYQAYQNYQEEHRPQTESETQREIQPEYAAVESPPPSNFQQQQAEQAAYEATLIAAPDVDGSSRSVNDFMMAGRQSQGDLSSVLSADQFPAPQPADQQSVQSVNHAKEILDPLAEDLAREQPSLAAGQDHSNIASISQLHIPGSFT